MRSFASDTMIAQVGIDENCSLRMKDPRPWTSSEANALER